LKEYKEMDFLHERSAMIIKKRLAVVEFVHGLELILKAILIRKGYCIYKFKNNKIFKNNEKIERLVSSDRTIELEGVIKFFKKEYPELSFNLVDKLRVLRNQITHKGTEISEKKRDYFIGAINCLIEVYEKEDIRNRKFLGIIRQAKLDI
jgi:hypothetical protein